LVLALAVAKGFLSLQLLSRQMIDAISFVSGTGACIWTGTTQLKVISDKVEAQLLDILLNS
jgi:hypothetical protein